MHSFQQSPLKKVFTKSGKWYRGVVEAADFFMARWHRDET